MATQTILVSGTIEEEVTQYNRTAPRGLVVTLSDTVTGDLAGTGIVHIFSTDYVDDVTQLNVISTRKINTDDGVLIMNEVGERRGDDVSGKSTVVGGTQKYKNATGQLILTGLHTNAGIRFVYAGAITLA